MTERRSWFVATVINVTLPVLIVVLLSIVAVLRASESKEINETTRPAESTAIEAGTHKNNVTINVKGKIKGFTIGFVLPQLPSPVRRDFTLETQRGDTFIQWLSVDQSLEVYGVPLAGTRHGQRQLKTIYGYIFELAKGTLPSSKKVSLVGDFEWKKGASLTFKEKKTGHIWKHVGPKLH